MTVSNNIQNLCPSILVMPEHVVVLNVYACLFSIDLTPVHPSVRAPPRRPHHTARDRAALRRFGQSDQTADRVLGAHGACDGGVLSAGTGAHTHTAHERADGNMMEFEFCASGALRS